MTTRQEILEIRFLGAISIQLGERDLGLLSSRKETALFAYLVETGKAQTREHLAELFWPDRTQDQCLKNLRVLLSRVRRNLPEYLEVTRTTIAFRDGAAYTLDLDHLKYELDQVRAGLVKEGVLTPAAVASLNRISKQYAGEFLTDLQVNVGPEFENWLEMKRRDLRAKVNQARRQLIAHALRSENYEVGLNLTNELLEDDFLSEDVHRSHMLLLAKSGQRELALRHFQSYKTNLARQFNEEPEESTVLLFEQIKSAEIGLQVTAAKIQTPQQRDNLAILLGKVKSFWIDGVLSRALPPEGPIPLKKLLVPHLLQNPWQSEIVLDGPTKDEKSFVDGDIGTLFKQMGGALLITGAPGSGKTVTLLLLVRQAIDWVDHDPKQPIPVVFHLAGWLPKDHDLERWMVGQLNRRYYIPVQIAREWLHENRIFPLLDGLDEVHGGRLGNCIHAINTYRQRSGLTPIAVCTRKEEYLCQETRLTLDGALELHPLDRDRVETFLLAASGSGQGKQRLFAADSELLELARTPLFLTMVSTIDEETLEEINPIQGTGLRHQVYAKFVADLLHRRDPRSQFSIERVKNWLGWLASQNLKQHVELFDIDGVQPSLLDEKALLHYLILSRTFCGLAIGLFLASFSFHLSPNPHAYIAIPFVGISAGLVLAVIDRATITYGASNHSGNLLFRLARILIIVLFCGGVSAVISRWLLSAGEARISLIIIGLIFAFLFGNSSARNLLKRDIDRVEQLTWSSSNGLKGAIGGFFLGVLLDLFFQLISTMLFPERPPLSIFPIISFFGVLLGVLSLGFSNKEIQKTDRPEAVIRSNLRNGTIFGLVAFCCAFPLFSLLGLYFDQMDISRPLAGRLGITTPLTYGLFTGLFFSLLVFFRFGALSVLKFMALRIILRINGHLPWNVSRFLDHAVHCGVLRRVGGAYFFMHRILMEHLGTQYIQKSDQAKRT